MAALIGRRSELALAREHLASAESPVLLFVGSAGTGSRHAWMRPLRWPASRFRCEVLARGGPGERLGRKHPTGLSAPG
jgi:hypothetical protein